MTNKYESKSFEAQISGRTVAPQSEGHNHILYSTFGILNKNIGMTEDDYFYDICLKDNINN